MTWRVSDILMRAKLVDELQLRSAQARQAQWGGRLAKHVVELGFASEPAVTDAIAQALAMPRVELGTLPKDPAALAKIDVALAEQKGMFPYALRDNGKTLFIAMADPSDLETVDFLAAKTGCRVKASVAGEKEILAAIWRHYKGQEPPASLMAGVQRPLARTPTGEMEMTDMHGNRLDVPASAKAPGAGAVATAHVQTPVPGTHGTPFAGYRVNIPPEVASALSPVAAEYLNRLQGEMDKTERVLRALVELCLQKQVFSAEEIRSMIARSAK